MLTKLNMVIFHDGSQITMSYVIMPYVNYSSIKLEEKIKRKFISLRSVKKECTHFSLCTFKDTASKRCPV